MDSILFLQSLEIPAADDGPLSQQTCPRSCSSNGCSTCSMVCDVGGFGDFYF